MDNIIIMQFSDTAINMFAYVLSTIHFDSAAYLLQSIVNVIGCSA